MKTLPQNVKFNYDVNKCTLNVFRELFVNFLVLKLNCNGDTGGEKGNTGIKLIRILTRIWKILKRNEQITRFVEI